MDDELIFQLKNIYIFRSTLKFLLIQGLDLVYCTYVKTLEFLLVVFGRLLEENFQCGKISQGCYLFAMLKLMFLPVKMLPVKIDVRK